MSFTFYILNLLKKHYLYLLIICIGAFLLRFYRLDELMIFNGDQGRDYLAAQEMILDGKIPLVGIPSSVPWLKQGPLFIYLLAPILWLFNFNPLSGAYLTIFIDILAVLMIFKLAKDFFNEETGLMTSLLYAVSPLVVVYSRLPYHISPIPLATLLFMWSVYKLITGKTKFFVWAWFFFGLLWNFELSTAIFALIFIWLWFDYKWKLKPRYFVGGIMVLLITLSPKIIYDFQHGFTQILGFWTWMVYRITAFFGFTGRHTVSLTKIRENLQLFSAYWRDLTILNQSIVAGLLLVLVVRLFWQQFKWTRRHRQEQVGYYLILLWLLGNLAGFLVHQDPPVAYFMALFPIPAILLGFMWSKAKYLTPVFIIIIFWNLSILLHEDYLSISRYNVNRPFRLRLSQSLDLRMETARFIFNDAGGRKFNLVDGSESRIFPNNLDNYRYLLWYLGNEPVEDGAELAYIIYEGRNVKCQMPASPAGRSTVNCVEFPWSVLEIKNANSQTRSVP